MKEINDIAREIFLKDYTYGAKHLGNFRRNLGIDPYAPELRPEYIDLLQIVLNYIGKQELSQIAINATPLHDVLMTIAQETTPTDQQTQDITRQLKLYVGAIAKKPKDITELTKDIVRREHQEQNIKKILPQAIRSLIPEYDNDVMKQYLTDLFKWLRDELGEATEQERLNALETQISKSGSDYFSILFSFIGEKKGQTKLTTFLQMTALEQDKVMGLGIYTAFVNNFQNAYSSAYKARKDIAISFNHFSAGFRKTFPKDWLGKQQEKQKEMKQLFKKHGKYANRAVREFFDIQDLAPTELQEQASAKADEMVQTLRNSLKATRLNKETSKAAKTAALRKSPSLKNEAIFRKADISDIVSSRTPENLKNLVEIDDVLQAKQEALRKIADDPIEAAFTAMIHSDDRMAPDTFKVFAHFITNLKFQGLSSDMEGKNEDDLMNELQNVSSSFDDSVWGTAYSAAISGISVSGEIKPSDFLKMSPKEQTNVMAEGITEKHKADSSAHAEAGLFAEPSSTTPANNDGVAPKVTVVKGSHDHGSTI